MGLRMRKSIRLAKGVRLNVGRKSASISVGNRYGHTTISTGSSRRSGSKAQLREDLSTVFQSNVSEKKRESDRRFLKVCSVIMMIIGIVSLLLSIVAFCTAGMDGIIFVVTTLFCFMFARIFNPDQKSSKSHRK